MRTLLLLVAATAPLAACAAEIPAASEATHSSAARTNIYVGCTTVGGDECGDGYTCSMSCVVDEDEDEICTYQCIAVEAPEPECDGCS